MHPFLLLWFLLNCCEIAKSVSSPPNQKLQITYFLNVVKFFSLNCITHSIDKLSWRNALLCQFFGIHINLYFTAFYCSRFR